jgi:hypothetical protein
MKLAFTLALVLVAIAAHADPLPLGQATRPGRLLPARLYSSGSFCVPSQGAQDAIAKPANGTWSVRMDIERKLLFAQRRLSARIAFPCRRAIRCILQA